MSARLVLTLLLCAVLVTPAWGQIPRSRGSRGAVAAAPNAAKLMVANPHIYGAADSAAAVAIGTGMRDRIQKIVGRDYAIVPREQMNSALVQFAYPADAILTPAVARTLANSLQAPLLVNATMMKGEGGLYTVTARLAGVNADAGSVVVAKQAAGQSPTEFGGAIAQQLEPALKAATDAKACIDQRTTAPDKAAAAANKALATHPTNGLAHYCVALLALDKKTKGDSAAAEKHLQDAVAGDPLSLAAWTGLSVRYQLANDTARTVQAFSQMLLVAPTNQKLREEIFRYFLSNGLTDKARQVAEQGLASDSSNADLWDLKSNACIFANDFKCAVDALEQVFALDSTAADSTFYTKISVTAAQQPDTVRLLKWAKKGVAKYPNNTALLEQLSKAYSLTGQADSTLAISNRLIAGDTMAIADSARKLTDTTARAELYAPAVGRALASAQILTEAKRPRDALPYLDFAIARGDAQAKENAAIILFNGARPLFQAPQDFATASELLRRAAAVANPTGKIAAPANYLLGLASLAQVGGMDETVTKEKSCEGAKQMETLLLEAEKALEVGKSFQSEDAAKRLDGIQQYKKRINAMNKAFCK